ncbi:other/FunK1 protein kinase [Coprinopsis cinerea okayama7|uniref:Other/FunK1 protein kinase n=1 Tax=Coprinopsis cinerea (strain Okayama-7 / 130 / ATCC MYA-4618 / FGSC 9003) TaxID=240176 RepID=A8NAW9_COPC7|nr:other/FunK1 protein kinase [Coprinopsis cinerea okayama7\|eukprot:XP_001831971.2 other/FunK1 protein kinase [Coprinopsis cinerea okayama7\
MDAEVSTCSVGKFFENYLPTQGVPFNAVVDDLKKQKTLVSRGRSLEQKPSSSTQRPLFPQTFKSLKTLFRSRTTTTTRVMKTLQTIGNAVRKALGRATDCEITDYSLREEHNIRENAQGCLTSNLEDPLHPTEVVVPMTVIADDGNYTSSEEAKAKLLSRATEIMNEDARRRFCFGVTCERSEVTLWRFSRSIVIKSTPFDMTEQPDLLLRLFVALFTAPPHQLGYDPLVNLLPDLNYVYQIPSDSSTTPLYFKTVHPIWDVKPTCLAGRRTRIWEVEQVLSPSDPTRVPGTPNRALKDVFLNSDTRTESDIQEELFADIAKFGRHKNWRSRPLLKDFAQTDLEGLAEALEGDLFKQYFSRIVAKHVGEGDVPALDNPTAPPPKRRCLFLYEHVCTALNNIPTLGEAVDILKSTLIPLRLMFCAGWVHRDVSPGNVLAYRESPTSTWTVKLSDLEHAKRFPDPGSIGRDPITGTPSFIACEVLDGRHFFPLMVDPDKLDPPYRPVPVLHTYQHDLESIWWILLWLATTRVNQNLPRLFGQTYFQQRVDLQFARARCVIFRESLSFEPPIRESLPESLQTSFYKRLNTLRNNLYATYINRNLERKHRDVESFSWIVSEGMRLFFDGVARSRDKWSDTELMTDTEPRTTSVAAAMLHLQPPASDASKKRKNVEVAGRASKRMRTRRVCDNEVPQRRGPTTRSTTRNTYRVTRSTTRSPLRIESRLSLGG